jgi:ABC-type nitrate/sulfonate/bicarbonate transport system permease component
MTLKILIVLLLILWEIAAAMAIFPPMSFPRISAIVATCWGDSKAGKSPRKRKRRVCSTRRVEIAREEPLEAGGRFSVLTPSPSTI